MDENLLTLVQKNAEKQPAWLQKKRSLAVMLQKRFALAEQQQKWLTQWQQPELMTTVEDSYLVHEGTDYVALPLLMAVEKYPELLQENLMEKAVRWQDSQLNAIHLALSDAGQFIYVPDNTTLKEPLKLNLTTKSCNPHNLIIVGAGAKVSIEEISNYKSEQPIYAATEILIGTGAAVDFYQSAHYQSSLVRQATHSYQARQSVLNLAATVPKSKQGYSSFYSFLDGSDSHWNVHLAANVKKDQQQKVITQVDGYGMNTSAQVAEWGWTSNNSQLDWGKLTTVDDEPLELHQDVVTGSAEKVTINDQQSAGLKTAAAFFKQYLPQDSWLSSRMGLQ